MLKRRQVKVICYITAAIAILTLLIGAVAVAATPSFDKDDYEVISYSVRGGDTLWTIGQKYKMPDDDVREWIYEVEWLNDLETVSLRPSQRLLIYNARN